MDLWSSISSLWASLWEAFKNASPLANFVTISTPVLGLIAGLRWWVRRRLKSKDARIHDLEEERDRQVKKLDDARSELNELRQRCVEFETRLPETALSKAEAELRGNNHDPANRACTEWLQREG